MSEENRQLMDGELDPQGGTDTDLSPALLTLEKHRITCDRQLEPMDFLFQLFGRPCFPRKELVGITGKAKSGKTFLVSMLMACCVARDVLAFHRQDEQPLRILWYDTEQSDESTQDILKNRIMHLIKTTTDLTDSTDNSCVGNKSVPSVVEKQIDVFNVRGVPWKDRRKLLLEAVTHYGPDLVIVDGIRDLVDDINDGVLAQEVLEELMQLAAASDCCIVCILHQNKASEDHNLRGWIGTELMHKAFETYACEKQLPDRIFEVKQTLTRKYDIFESLYFRVDKDGLPVACQGAQAAGSDSVCDNARHDDSLPPLNRTYILNTDDGSWTFNTRKLFNDALGSDDEVQASIFRQRVMQLSGITLHHTYNHLLKQALEEKIIEKTDRGKVGFYRAAPF